MSITRGVPEPCTAHLVLDVVEVQVGNIEVKIVSPHTSSISFKNFPVQGLPSLLRNFSSSLQCLVPDENSFPIVEMRVRGTIRWHVTEHRGILLPADGPDI